MDKSVLQVTFLSRDGGLGEAIARALGEGFILKTNLAMHMDLLQAQMEWSDVVCLDLRRSNVETEEEGFRLLDEIVAQDGHPPVLALCDAEDRGFLIRTIEEGASDVVLNPPNILELRILFERAYRIFAVERELKRIRGQEKSGGRLHDLLGSSPAMVELFKLAERVGPCDVNVLITGETGTGKELLARAMHQMGPRSTNPLVAFSCANLPEALVEDELFGHEKGAFTGAVMARQGRVEAANHGTLFLDEIGDLGLGLQPKLLRVLQEKTFERLGSNKMQFADVRLISATNRDLLDMVQQGKFREDLYYRLNVVELHLPALRERRDDIPVLVHHFLDKSTERFKKKAMRVSSAAMSVLEQHQWPGNVRELENTVQRAVVLAEGQTVEVAHLPAPLRNSVEERVTQVAVTDQIVGTTGEELEDILTETASPNSSYEEAMKQFKHNLVLRTLRKNGWRKAESARALGVARGYLHRLIHQLEIRQEEEPLPVEKAIKLPPPGPVM